MTNYKRQLQQALKDAGLLDSVDGIIGKNTVDAVNTAIKKAGLEPEPLLDDHITKNFTMAELTHSNTAVARGLSNQPNSTHRQNLIESAKELWQPVRDLLDAPMIVSSGYRSSAVNRAVGGSSTSAHSHGFAIDFTAPGFGNTRKIASFLAKELVNKGIKFDQIILEFPDNPRSWIHLGYKRGDGRQRGELLTAVKRDGRTVYLRGLH